MKRIRIFSLTYAFENHCNELLVRRNSFSCPRILFFCVCVCQNDDNFLGPSLMINQKECPQLPIMHASL